MNGEAAAVNCCCDEDCERSCCDEEPAADEPTTPKLPTVFERANRETDGMSFGLAIEAAKKGMKIARRGWNGKNQYVELAERTATKTLRTR